MFGDVPVPVPDPKLSSSPLLFSSLFVISSCSFLAKTPQQKSFQEAFRGYINNYEKALVVLNSRIINGVNNALSEFFTQVSAQSNLSLGSLLVTPIQRIPRYQLLLQDLIKHTPDDSIELDALELALDEVIALATAIDRCSLNQVDSDFKLKNVLDNFHPRYQTGLYVPGREIIAKV